MMPTSTIRAVLASRSLPWRKRKSSRTEWMDPSLNVKGLREGVYGDAGAGVGDNTTERQGEVARANMKLALKAPPAVG